MVNSVDCLTETWGAVLQTGYAALCFIARGIVKDAAFLLSPAFLTAERACSEFVVRRSARDLVAIAWHLVSHHSEHLTGDINVHALIMYVIREVHVK